MPRPRFHKLPPEKRERILEAAAMAFGTSGFEGASINQILEAANISKGAAYYYFDDKADLFATVVEQCFGVLFEHVPTQSATVEDFWDGLVGYFREAMRQMTHRPWMLGLMRAVWRLGPEARDQGPLGKLFEASQVWVQQLIRHGREIGAIRADLPEDLLVIWFSGIDLVTDQWMAERVTTIDDDVIESLLQLAMDAFRRLFDPPVPGREVVLKLGTKE